jgi:hypothetical protein
MRSTENDEWLEQQRRQADNAVEPVSKGFQRDNMRLTIDSYDTEHVGG